MVFHLNSMAPDLPKDPGRSALRGEWAVPGTVVFAADTAESGAVRVTGSGAGSGGHWRRLRFNESTEQSALLLLLLLLLLVYWRFMMLVW